MPPPFQSVIVDIAKLRDYSLSTSHPRGRAKARVFRSTLGITSDDADWLRDRLIDAVATRTREMRPTNADPHGQRFVLDFPITTAAGTAIVRSAWLCPPGRCVLRLITCYVL
jgi:hypothetical protein